MNSLAKRALLASAAALLVFVSVDCGEAANQPAASQSKVTETQKAAGIQTGDTILVKINGKSIKRSDLDNATRKVMPMMSFHQSVPPEKLKKIQTTALDGLINAELIYLKAKAEKQDKADPKEIDKRVEELKSRLPKGQSLEEVLKRSKMTMAELKEELKQDIVVQKYRQAKEDDLKKKSQEKVTEAYMKDYYQKNLPKFKEPEQYQIRTILLKADPAGGTKHWNEVKKKAEELVAKLKKGEDFASLAKSVSQDPYAPKGGDMGWVHKGSLFEEIDAAVDNMKVGEISAPVMTMYGYHIVKLEGKRQSAQKKFEDLNKESLRGELVEKEYKNSVESWLKDLKASAKIERINEIK